MKIALWWRLLLCLAIAAVAPDLRAQQRKTRNVIFVMTDGLRWQEVFRGADPALMNKDNGQVGDVDQLKAEFWRATPEERRQALFPFLWTEIARSGQIFGNRDRGSDAAVTNGL